MRKPLSHFLQGPILAAAGIGHPENFFNSLRRHGLSIETLALPDHYDFSENPFKDLNAEFILITEKDAVKCASYADSRLWAISTHGTLDDAFITFLIEQLHGYSAA